MTINLLEKEIMTEHEISLTAGQGEPPDGKQRKSKGGDPKGDKCIRRETWIVAAMIFAIDSTAAVAAPPINTWYLHTQRSGAQVPLESGAALIAVTTFVGIWLIQRQRSFSDTLGDMRAAIAGSFILVYLVIVVWSAFFAYGNAGPLNVLSSTLITNFTVLTGVVIASYFATATANTIAASRQDKRQEKPKDDVGSVA